jgi:hypothetical protein
MLSRIFVCSADGGALAKMDVRNHVANHTSCTACSAFYSAPLTWLLLTLASTMIPCRTPRLDKVANQITRSACDKRANSSRTQIELSITNSPDTHA